MAATYATLPDGTRVSMIASEDRATVWLYTRDHTLGGYRADRFGPDPFTAAGRLRAGAVRHFIAAAYSGAA